MQEGPAVAPFFAASHTGATALAWGALSGVGSGVGVAFLYRGMTSGRFSVVVPLSDVAAVALPVLVGVVLLGDRPAVLAWCGIVAAPPALWLLSRSGHEGDRDGGTASGLGDRTATGAGDGLIAGAGFALQFIALAQADASAGMWPLVAGRVASVLTLLPLIVRRPGRLRMPSGLAVSCLVVGALGTTALALYTLATREQLMSLVVVLTALYPAIPVLLGVTVLRERLARAQGVGLACAAAAIVLISLA